MLRTAYQYSPTTTEYLGEIKIQNDPINGSQWLIPPNVTLSIPPATAEYQIACWNGTAWETKADYRGMTYYKKADQTKLEITEIGVEPTDEYTDQVPQSPDQVWGGTKWEYPLNWYKERKKQEIVNAWNVDDEESVTTSVGEFECNSISRNRINSAISCMADSSTRQWTLYNGTTVTVTKAQLQSVIFAWMGRCDLYHTKYLQLKQSIENAATIAEVQAIHW